MRCACSARRAGWQCWTSSDDDELAFAAIEANAFAALSERELAVLRVLADGASNARVADTLSIGITTVKTHVGSILSKLHLGDRTEAVAFAWRHGLMNQLRSDVLRQ